MNKDLFSPVPYAEEPEMPLGLKGVAAVTWATVVPILVKNQILCPIDVPLLMRYCQLMDVVVRLEEVLDSNNLLVTNKDGVPKTNPQLTQLESATKTLIALATEFGFTPRARGRISSSQRAKATNAFDKLRTSD